MHYFVTEYISNLGNSQWLTQTFSVLAHFIIQYLKIYIKITINLIGNNFKCWKAVKLVSQTLVY